MGVFENSSVLLELKKLPIKEKKKLKSAVTKNGGNICFVVNEQCSLVLTNDVSNLSSNRLRSIQKYQTPVVGVDYVYSCLERGVLLPVDGYKLDASAPSAASTKISFVPLKNEGTELSMVPTEHAASVSKTQRAETPEKDRNILEKFRIYTETDSDLPPHPNNFQVAKYSVFEKVNSHSWCVLELQSSKGQEGWRYYVVRYWKDHLGAKKAAVKDMLVFLTTSEDALEVYKALKESLETTGLQLRSSTPAQAQDLGSAALQRLLLEEKLNTGTLSQEVGAFVELLWMEALGCLGNILTVSVDKLSLNDVSRVEGLLLQAQRHFRELNHDEVSFLLHEVYTLMPFRVYLPPSLKSISQKLDICQLIRDVLNVSEMTLRSPAPSTLGKYRALRCSIESVPTSSSEFQDVAALLQDKGNNASKSKVQIKQVLRVGRGVELQTFKNDVGNIKPLLHSSSPSNFVGLLSRGLLLPHVGVEFHGIERTDVGNLGCGIYFSNSFCTSLKYSKPSVTDGSRLLLVCDVALGRCKDVHKRDLTLTQAPEGHHSVHGVCRTPSSYSEFEDDEYVVYSPDQVKLKYVVQFSMEGDQLKEFNPTIVTSATPDPPSSVQALSLENIESIKNPLEGVMAGLLDSSGQQLPLQAVHIKCKLIDLLSQVIIFQQYTNLSSVPIEAKYVFPLSDSAAVCGFEAFINGKHVVGQVKEKETARKEYKKAIEGGHGAYLMDQDSPDVFTISVGNLPPGATVVIKVTFVSELIVKDGSILFSLPGSVAPWQESAALNQTTQVTVKKVCVTDETGNTREFTLDMSVEMPYEISSLTCITHKVKIKKTDCKAVVSVLPGQVMGPEGFLLTVSFSQVHLPRMWVEKHPDKDSQACMLVFYPDFDINSSSSSDEVILLIDTSESMKGESLSMAQATALQVLKTLDHNLKLNIILFGTDHTEAFLRAQPLVEAYQEAESFIKHFAPVGGSTELWRPLRALSLLPPSSSVRNMLLLSDGHIQNSDLTLRLLRDNAQHSRLFTCGFSQTANRHMLRTLAQAGGGAFEFFDIKTKHNWAEKVACQVKRMASPGCSSVSVKWQQFNPTAPSPVQAPKQLHALFNNCHTLVYGFVPHCTQATLLGNLSGQELKTVVSTSELQKTRGTFLHKLTARALIRDYEDGSLDTNEAKHEGKKAELKQFIIELSKEFGILSQFTSFVAIEERDAVQAEGFTDIPKLMAEEDVDFLPYVSWIPSQPGAEEKGELAQMSLMRRMSSTTFDDEEGDEDGDEDGDEEGDEEGDEDGDEDGDNDSDVGFGLFSSSSNEEFPTTLGVVSPKYFATSRSLYEEAEDYLPQVELCAATSCEESEPLYPGFSAAPLAADGLPNLLFDAASPPPPPPPPLSHLASTGHQLLLTETLPAGYSTSLLKVGAPASDHTPPLPPLQHLWSGFSTTPVPVAKLPNLLFSGSVGFDKVGAPASYPPPLHSPCPLPSSSAAEQHRILGGTRGRSPIYSFSFSKVKAPASDPHPPAHPPPPRRPPRLSHPESRAYTESIAISERPLRGERVQFEGQRIHSFNTSSMEESLYALVPPSSAEQGDSSPANSAQKMQECVPYLKRRRKMKTKGISLEPISNVHSQSSAGFQFIRSADPEATKLRWRKIFGLQHSEGYWELTTELGELIDVNIDVFANGFLKSKGINSLGVKARANILRLVATLLVLQLLRMEKLEEGKVLRTLFCLDDSSHPRPERWQEVKRAVHWVCWADQQYPSIYSRLEFGLSWESSTRQLLGYEDLPPFSALSGLNLRRTSVPLLVH